MCRYEAVIPFCVGTFAIFTIVLVSAKPVIGQDVESATTSNTTTSAVLPDVESGSHGNTETLIQWTDSWLSPDRVQSTVQAMLMFTVLSVAPAVLLMTTSFVRVTVVLSLLRQALGSQQLPPNQVMTAIALFITFVVMTPVWTEVYESAIKPYAESETQLSLVETGEEALKPIRRFMARQIRINKNDDDVWLFLDYLPDHQAVSDPYIHQVPLQALLPAYVLSELKTAFIIGFQIYLPFLIVDLVVSSVTISMGMFMLPPVMVSLPLKLLLFVLVDGWHLVVEMLLQSFGTL